MSGMNSGATTSGNCRPSHSPGRVLSVVLPVAIIGLVFYWWSKGLEERVRGDMAVTVLSRMFSAQPLPASGTMAFADADNDLVADLPADQTKLADPQTLVFSYVATEEAGPGEEAWTELLEAIKQKTGKETKFLHYNTADEQMKALQEGELHIVGVNTGLVQAAVEKFGFVPLCTFGRDDGSWGYTMEFIVPAGSSIRKLSDIKGHKVMFTTLDSNSGCKAPLVLLKEQHNLLPERDYTIAFSQGHESSIKGVAAKEFEVAPVASDVLARIAEKNEIDPASVVSIYKSERFPPATLGYAHNLAPALREAIGETLLGFEWKETGLAKEFGPEAAKFVAVDYKNDWANTRRIDQVIAEARKAGQTKTNGK
ncbi:MAG: phosphate/phosphite/phosphonate ABC transporter substrate-binding protein [Pirellulales bacterium]|nr:phosphate/phosphite/phosphonate ABC transporter substrate-binding protein [Pirellulales bacterium]